MERTETDHLFAADPGEGAAWGLLALMTGISEGYWCAAWLIDLEYELWSAAQTGAGDHGLRIPQRQCDLLRLLSEEAEGWWIYGEKGPEFIHLEDWKQRVIERDRASRNRSEAPPT